jgi:hypothetical protein
MSHVLKIENMKITGDNNTVNEVRCFLTVTANTGKSETSVFSVELDEPDANNFIEFNNLTEELVNDWVISNLGQDEYDARVQGLESKIAEGRVLPKTVNAPWLAQANTV